MHVLNRYKLYGHTHASLKCPMLVNDAPDLQLFQTRTYTQNSRPPLLTQNCALQHSSASNSRPAQQRLCCCQLVASGPGAAWTEHSSIHVWVAVGQGRLCRHKPAGHPAHHLAGAVHAAVHGCDTAEVNHLAAHTRTQAGRWAAANGFGTDRFLKPCCYTHHMRQLLGLPRA